jgi:two-component system, cell cycle sensor histidine kinase and response regulator CckA
MTSSQSAAPTRVLVVEDEAIVAMDLEQQLTASGYEVVGLLDTGEQAVAQAAELRPDVVLMDIRLRGKMDGIEAAARIRAEADLPVVYLTAHSDEETFGRARSTDPMAYVLKPFDARSLRAAIELGLYRHRTDRKLRQVERWMTSTMRSVGDALIATDLAGRVTYLNPMAERLAGVSFHEATGMEFETVFPLIDRHGDTIEGPVRQVLREGLVVGLAEGTRLVRRDGRIVPVDDSAAPIRDDHGVMTGVVIVLRDATAQSRTQDQLRETEAQLRHAQKLEAVGRLAGGLAHDFNNLMTVILGYNEILRGLTTAPETREPLEHIRYAGQRATELTHRLLAFSRKQVLEPQTLDLNEIVRSLAGMLGRLIGEDIELDLQLAQRLDGVRADRGQVEQIVLNLATNARDAMPSGGTLTLATANVRLLGAEALDASVMPGDYIRFEMRDCGHGIDSATLGRIFEPFFTTKESGKGTGLGLAMVYNTVRELGGAVQVVSEVGKGTTIRIHLPQSEPADADAPPEIVADAPPGQSETILVVEDNEPLRSLIQTVLQQARYSTIVCSDGAAALQHLEAGTPVDAMLVDMVMPRMGGSELAERVRSVEPRARLLFMSGYAEEAIWPSGPHARDRVSFIQKPFSMTQLCVKLRQVLDA